VRDRLDEFDAHDAEVVVILFTRARNLRGYRGRYVAPLRCVTDETREVYRAYGLGRGGVWRVWGPKVWALYLSLIRHGGRVEKPTEDTSQLGGDFVVGRDGRVVLAFRQTGPEERPSVDDLLAAVASAP
jgi:hypothetical protein